MCTYRKKSGFKKNRNPGPGCLICGQRLLYPLVKPLSTLFSKRLGLGTLGAREFSCAVSGFGQVSMVNRAARDFGWRCFSPWPTSKHPPAREKKPPVPRLGSRFSLAFKLFMHFIYVYCSLIALFFSLIGILQVRSSGMGWLSATARRMRCQKKLWPSKSGKVKTNHGMLLKKAEIYRPTD